MHFNLYTHTHIHTHTHQFHTKPCLNLSKKEYIYIYIYTHTYIYICVCVCVCTYICHWFQNKMQIKDCALYHKSGVTVLVFRVVTPCRVGFLPTIQISLCLQTQGPVDCFPCTWRNVPDLWRTGKNIFRLILCTGNRYSGRFQSLLSGL